MEDARHEVLLLARTVPVGGTAVHGRLFLHPTEGELDEVRRMLVLSRRVGERIVVPLPDRRMITITVLSVRGGKVRLGIDAPPDIPVHREELFRELQAKGDNLLLHPVESGDAMREAA